MNRHATQHPALSTQHQRSAAPWPRLLGAVGVALLAAFAPLALVGEGSAGPGLALSASAHSILVGPGEEVTYGVLVTSPSALAGQMVSLSANLPRGFRYQPGSSLVNGRPAADPALSGSAARWSGLPAPGGERGRYGVHTFLQDIMDQPHIATQLGWSRALTGPGGYVKQLLYPITASTPGPQQSWIDFVTAAYDRGLTPVLRLQGSYDPRAARWEKPRADADGGYASTAEAFRRVVAGLPRREGYLLYVEVWNEPNIDAEWGGTANPVEYARFLLAAGQALRSLGDPRIVILNAGLAPGGNFAHLDFIDAMFQAVPAAVHAFDAWASHPYAGNHPPGYDADYYSVRGYRWELERLARYRNVCNLKVVVTEAGYALGNHDDPRFPPIDESNRAAYTREALEKHWLTDDALLAVMPFELADPFNGWSAFDWVYPSSGTRADGAPTQVHAVFEAIKALPKPGLELAITFRLVAPAAEGSYRPGFQASIGSESVELVGEAVMVSSLEGAGVVSGRVALQGRASSAGVVVSLGDLSARTATDGSYQLAVPSGSYTISVAAPGYLSARRERVPVVPSARTTLPPVKLLAGNVVPEPPGAGRPEQVDRQDLSVVVAAYDSAPPTNPAADLNGDGSVNLFDLVIATGNLGRTEPSPWP